MTADKPHTDEAEDAAETAWNEGYDAGYLAAFAELASGRARLPEWAGFTHDRPIVCDGCQKPVPLSEYGFVLHDELWATVAPRPGAEDFYGSGVLCLDCIESRLGRRIGSDDISMTTHYGDRPTRRAAVLWLEEVIAYGDHLVGDDALADEGAATPPAGDN